MGPDLVNPKWIYLKAIGFGADRFSVLGRAIPELDPARHDRYDHAADSVVGSRTTLSRVIERYIDLAIGSLAWFGDQACVARTFDQ
ncbi:MAG: hypothetical protein R3B67_13010 [Phycisphaerales bacterium]